MRWCCQNFESAYRRAGQRGFAILVGVDDVIGPYFLWHHRAIEKGREGEVQAPPDVNIVTDTGLKRFYRRCADQLVRAGLEVSLSS